MWSSGTGMADKKEPTRQFYPIELLGIDGFGCVCGGWFYRGGEQEGSVGGGRDTGESSVSGKESKGDKFTVPLSTPNNTAVLPGGWQTPDSVHVCLYLLRNCGSSYSFSVVNTRPLGLEYHPSNFDSTTGRQTKQLCLTVWDIPPERVTDSTFCSDHSGDLYL